MEYIYAYLPIFLLASIPAILLSLYKIWEWHKEKNKQIRLLEEKVKKLEEKES